MMTNMKIMTREMNNFDASGFKNIRGYANEVRRGDCFGTLHEPS